MSQGLLVVAKSKEKGAKVLLMTTRHSLSPATTKGEFVDLLKDINDRPLLVKFLRSQRKFLENKGPVNQFTKMDVKKFKELMKFTLANHAGWVKLKKGLFEMSRGSMLEYQPCGMSPTSGCGSSRASGRHHGFETGWTLPWTQGC